MEEMRKSRSHLHVNPNLDTVSTGTTASEEERIVLNVGGIRHETLLSTLKSKPNTRLSVIARKHRLGRGNEYFFDRHPGVFNTVMDYYRTGELHMPLDVCGAVVKRELAFWGVDDSGIETCCWVDYSSFLDNQKILASFNRSVEREQEQIHAVDGLTGWPRYRLNIWMILDHPRSSKAAMAYAITSFVFVLASITGFCVETLPEMGVLINHTRSCDGSNQERVEMRVSNKGLVTLDKICTAFFTAELLVRIIFAPKKFQFFKSVMNFIDILALLPLYAQIILNEADKDGCLKSHRAVIEIIFVLRIIRIFRIFHLVKHYKALRILVHAVRASFQELLMLAIFLFIAMLVFSTLVYYAEREETSHGDEPVTIPLGFWWSIITMTTVGYGDISPKTPMGHVVGGICAVCGVLLVALTFPVISNNFTLFYLHARTRDAIVQDHVKAPPECVEENCTTSRSNTPNSLQCKRSGSEGQALLRDEESNSTTDESGIMLHGKTGEDTSGENQNSVENHQHLRAPIFDTTQL